MSSEDPLGTVTPKITDELEDEKVNLIVEDSCCRIISALNNYALGPNGNFYYRLFSSALPTWSAKLTPLQKIYKPTHFQII